MLIKNGTFNVRTTCVVEFSPAPFLSSELRSEHSVIPGSPPMGRRPCARRQVRRVDSRTLLREATSIRTWTDDPGGLSKLGLARFSAAGNHFLRGGRSAVVRGTMAVCRLLRTTSTIHTISLTGPFNLVYIPLKLQLRNLRERIIFTPGKFAICIVEEFYESLYRLCTYKRSVHKIW